MASRPRKTRMQSGYRGGDEGRSADVEKLLQRTPQFQSLTKAAQGSEHVLTDSQTKFVEDFAAEVARGAVTVPPAAKARPS